MIILCFKNFLSIGIGLLPIHGLFIINHFLTDELKSICIFQIYISVSTLYMFYNNKKDTIFRMKDDVFLLRNVYLLNL
ncbi:hypothetical protein COI93_06110 [Bacillus cereus]|uniref:Uncharacterized protein n=1 Tax=Bacillus cereus TaxID=1396 RepID=A0A2B0MPV7_BACCE|nr:hypothetical protein COI93_06110 [Bacillus cereus]